MTSIPPSRFGKAGLKPKRVFIFHFNESEALELASRVRALGIEVDYEYLNGAHGCKRVAAMQPDLIVISQSRLPSHGRASADAIVSGKKTRHIPLLFVGGNPEAVEKAKSLFQGAVFCRQELIEPTIKQLLGLK